MGVRTAIPTERSVRMMMVREEGGGKGSVRGQETLRLVLHLIR